MRPIKFKIWNKKKNEWHHKEPISLFGEVIIMGEILNANLEDNPISLEELNNLVPLQFTGLLDKNGKEIYEGDIVKATMVGGFFADLEVTFENGEFVPKYVDGYSELEVIGNIYENPELLNNER